MVREYPDGYHPDAPDGYHPDALDKYNPDAPDVDLVGVEIDTECKDVNTVAIQYDDCMTKLLDKYASLKTIQVVETDEWLDRK